jgi:hypothetical protein
MIYGERADTVTARPIGADMSKSTTTLCAIGFWPDVGQDWIRSLPSPQQFMDPHWHSEERNRVSEYLKSGVLLHRYRGFSHCRFACGIPHHAMGSCDLTDGTWVWPEGLAHYIDVHQVRPPDVFVQTAAAHNWHVPEIPEEALVRLRQLKSSPSSDGTGYEYQLWCAWGRDRASDSM